MSRYALRTLLAAASLGVLATAVVNVAVAQPGHPPPRHGKPAAKPAAAPGDAGVGDAATAEEPQAPAGALATMDAGPAAPPIAHIDLADGGIKPSPLNPTAAELPPATSAPAPDYDKLLGDVSALRARVAALTDTLFRSRVAITLEADGSHAKIARLAVSLDDGIVYDAPPNTSFERATPLYVHGVAPGRHAIVVDVDRKDDRDDTFRTSQRSRFLVDVPRDQQLDVALEIDDDSNMGKDFPGDHSGRYDLRVRAKASAKPVK